jgi:hypothetical protein
MFQPHCLNKNLFFFSLMAVSYHIGCSVATLVEQNLDDADARHLMVLTKVRGLFMLPKLSCFP